MLSKQELEWMLQIEEELGEPELEILECPFCEWGAQVRVMPDQKAVCPHCWHDLRPARMSH